MTDGDDLVDEIVKLQDAFEDYAETSQATQRERRVENIQVLVALAVVGAAISVFSYSPSNNILRKSLSSSDFLSTLFLIFIGANVLFLFLKLLTIPLYKPNQQSWVAYIHRYIEPLLYFFTVSGAGFGLLVWTSIAFTDFDPGPTSKVILAVISILVPSLIASVVAQLSRINSILNSYQQSLTNIERSFQRSELTESFTEEEQIEMMVRLQMFLIPSSISFRILNLLLEISADLLDDVSSVLYDLSSVLPGIVGNIVSNMAAGIKEISEIYLQFTKASYDVAKDSTIENYRRLLNLAIRSSSSRGKSENDANSESEKLRKLLEKAKEDELTNEEVKELNNLLAEYYEWEKDKYSASEDTKLSDFE